MKKRLFLIASAALVLAACAKEEAYQFEESPIAGRTKISIGASFELPESGATKSDIDDDGNFTWATTDAIWIGSDYTVDTDGKAFGQLGIEPLSGKIGPGYINARFSGYLSGHETAVAAISPAITYDEDKPDYNAEPRFDRTAKKLYVSLPKARVWKEAQVSSLNTESKLTRQADNLLIARYSDIYDGGYEHGKTEGLEFKNAGGLFRLELAKLPLNATKVVFTTDKKITGEFLVEDTVEKDVHGNDVHYPVINTSETSVEAEKSVSFDILVTDSAQSDRVLFIPVPVGKYKIGFKVLDGNDNDKVLWEFSTSRSNSVRRGHMVKMPPLTFVTVGGSGEGATNIIVTPEGYTGTVYLPSTENNIYVRMYGTDGPINIAYSQNGDLKPANVYLQALGDITTLNINLPESHVELTGEDKVHTLTNVKANTSINTFVVDNKVQIGKSVSAEETVGGLTITGGSLDLGATVEGTVTVNIPPEAANTTENKVAININNSIKKLDVQRAAYSDKAADKIYVSLSIPETTEQNPVEVELEGLNVDEVNCNLYVAPGVVVKTLSTKAAENTVEGDIETLSASGANTIVTVTENANVTASITAEKGATIIVDENALKDDNGNAYASANNQTEKDESSTITTVDLSSVVAYIGGNTYTTLDAAFEAVKAGETIVLQKDITQDAGFIYDKTGVGAKLNLNGYTVTVNNGANVNNRAFKINNGTLEVYGGSIVAVGSGTTSSNGAGCYGAFRVEAGGVLNAHDLELTNSRPWGLNVKVLGGTAELTNVKITSSYGGGIEVTEADLGTHSQSGTATLTNCTFTQTGYFDHCSTALSVSGGSSLTINSGSYTSENYALYVFSSGGIITVKDGTFSGNKDGVAIVAAIDTNTYPQYTGGLQLEGGNYTGGFNITSPASMSITGGTFDHDPTAYLAPGYTTSGSNPWTVIKREGAVFNLTELQAAISNGVTPIYYAGEAITEAFTLAPAAATVINGLKVNHQTVAANATTLTINGDVTLNDAEITTKAYCGISVSEGKKVTLMDCFVDGSSATASDSRAMDINGGAVVTIDGSTIKGPATAGYSRCLNILGDGAKVDVINGSTLSVSHYAVNMPSSTVNAVVNVKNSSVNTGWAISNIWKTDNTVNFEACTLNSLNDKGYHTSNAFSAFVFNTTSSGNKVTVKDCAVSVRSTTGNFQTLVSLRNSGDAISFIGKNTISLKDEALNQVIDPANLGKVNDNTLTFDADNLAAVNDYLDADCVVTGPVDDLYTVTYVAQVFYYWDTDNGAVGTYCTLAAPFVNGWLANGEHIRIEKSFALSSSIACQLTSGQSFTMDFGNYTITKGDYSISLPAGVSVVTDKQTDVFSAAGDAVITETENNGKYTYTAVEKTYVAQIDDVKYGTLAEAIAAAQNGDTVMLVSDAVLEAALTINKDITLDLGTSSISGNVEDYLIQNQSALTITADAENPGKIYNVSTGKGHGAIRNETSGTITINGGIFGDNDNDPTNTGVVNSGCALRNRGKAIINGGVFTTAEPAYSNGIWAYAIVSGESDVAANITFNGGHIYGKHGDLCNNHGTMVVNDVNTYGTAEYYSVYAWKDGTTTVKGGNFINNYHNYAKTTVLFCADEETATIEVTGGNFTKGTDGKLASGKGTVIVSGGTFNKQPEASIIAADYEAVDNGNGTWTVQELQGVAQIGTTTYETLAEAIAAVPTDGTKTTIKMIANEAMATGATLEVAASKNIVLDLNGKVIAGNGGNGANFFFLTNRGVLEITDSSAGQNGKITGTWTNPDSGYSKQFNTIYNIDGKLTLSAGTVEVTSGYLSYAVNNSSNAWGVGDDKETVFTITGGTVTAPSGDAAIRVYQNCGSNSNPLSHNTLNISGGLIKDGGIFVDTYIYKANPASSGDHISTTINISGGEIHGLIDMKMRHAYHTSLNVTGGNFVDAKMWVRKYTNEWGSGLAEPTVPVVNISGGTWNFVSGKAFGLAYDCGATSWSTYTKPYSITGGTFNVDPTTFVAEGHSVSGNSPWTVQ